MKKNILITLAALSLLLSGCGASQPSSAAASSSAKPSSSAQPSSSKSSAAPSSSAAPAEQTPVTQTATPDADGNGETITWDAQDANKESDGFSDAGKFSSTGSYVQYTFVASMAMKARLFVTVENRSSNVWNRETQSGHQSIWYNWYDGDDWKYNVEVNGAAIDQSTMGNYTVNGVEIPMKELVYADFLAEGASTLEAPWFEFNVKQGKNTLKIERNLGYSVNMKAFKVVGKKVA